MELCLSGMRIAATWSVGQMAKTGVHPEWMVFFSRTRRCSQRGPKKDVFRTKIRDSLSSLSLFLLNVEEKCMLWVIWRTISPLRENFHGLPSIASSPAWASTWVYTQEPCLQGSILIATHWKLHSRGNLMLTTLLTALMPPRSKDRTLYLWSSLLSSSCLHQEACLSRHFRLLRFLQVLVRVLSLQIAIRLLLSKIAGHQLFFRQSPFLRKDNSRFSTDPTFPSLPLSQLVVGTLPCRFLGNCVTVEPLWRTARFLLPWTTGSCNWEG